MWYLININWSHNNTSSSQTLTSTVSWQHWRQLSNRQSAYRPMPSWLSCRSLHPWTSHMPHLKIHFFPGHSQNYSGISAHWPVCSPGPKITSCWCFWECCTHARWMACFLERYTRWWACKLARICKLLPLAADRVGRKPVRKACSKPLYPQVRQLLFRRASLSSVRLFCPDLVRTRTSTWGSIILQHK